MLSESQAAAAVCQAARSLEVDQDSRFFKKVDSTMRGHPGSELAVMMETLGIHRALVCPAFPQQGRVVRDGRLFVRGTPLGETEFAEKAGVSDLRSFFRPNSPYQTIRLDAVRGGADTLIRLLNRPGVSIADAETADDLDMLAEVGERAGMQLYCGSAGLGRALSARVAACERRDPRRPRRGGAIIIIAGSRSSAAREQSNYLEAKGIGAVWVTNDAIVNDSLRNADVLRIANMTDNREAVLVSVGNLEHIPGREQQTASVLAQIAKGVLERVPAGGLILTGGDTAAAVCRALDCSALDLYGEVQPGLVWGILTDGMCAGLPVVTKAGGFGNPETLMDALIFLQDLQKQLDD